MESPMTVFIESPPTIDIKPRICDFCGDCFEDPSAFDDHYKTHLKVIDPEPAVSKGTKSEEKSSSRKSFNCDNCNMTFFLDRSFRYHRCPNLGERPYTCHLCPKRFRTRKLLMAHIRTHEKRHKCEMCGKSFANNSALISHCRRHIGDLPYVCEICKKQFPIAHYLQLHKNTHIKPFKCTHCDKSFALKQKLIDHNREHEGQESYTCIYCQRSFTYKAYLERHQCALDPGNSFACDKCDRTFSLEHLLKRHSLIHDKPYKCNECSKTFSQKNYMLKHCNTKHCNKSFNWQDEKKRHEQVYKKDKCDSAEDKPHAYNMVTKRKSKEKTGMYKKPAICDLCLKVFSERQYMLRHRVRHFDNKNHVCNMCHKTFQWNYQLLRHQARIHDNNSGVLSESNMQHNYLTDLDCPASSSTQSSENMELNQVESIGNEQLSKRRREKNPDLWIKNIKKKKKNTGNAYYTAKGKLVDAKTVKPPCNDRCRLKCTDKISEDVRETIFKNFWKIGDLTGQREYIFKSMKEVRPKYTMHKDDSKRSLNYAYYLKANDEDIRVCKHFFMATLDIGNSMIVTTLKKAGPDGTIETERRGKHENRRRIDTEAPLLPSKYLKCILTITADPQTLEGVDSS